ncbi:MAG: alpha/beta fold hydrolase [Candidatus Woesearchaeota archaeon]
MTTKDISFTNSRGQKLAGIIRYTDPIEPVKYPVVIVLHGFASTKHHDLTADIANNLVYSGYLTLRFDFQGHGDSEGAFEEQTIHQQVDDVFAALDFVSELEYADPDRIMVIGTDIGGNIALLAAARDARIKALVIQGARSHFDNHINSWFKQNEYDDLMRRGIHHGPDFKIRKEYVRSARAHDIIEHLKQVHAPILFLHGTDDLRVKIVESRQLLIGANQPRVLEEVEGADHWFRQHRKEFVALSAAWFKRWVR